MDDTVSIHYVVERLEDILKKHELHMPEPMFKDISEFRREFIYLMNHSLLQLRREHKNKEN